MTDRAIYCLQQSIDNRKKLSREFKSAELAAMYEANIAYWNREFRTATGKS